MDQTRGFVSQNRDLIDHVRWLSVNGINVNDVLEHSRSSLRKQGRFLPVGSLDIYQRKVILGQFLRAWMVKYQKMQWDELVASEDQGIQKELKLLHLAVLIGADERCFEKLISTMCKRSVFAAAGRPIGDATSFREFVGNNSGTLAHRMFQNYDVTRPGSAIKYLERTAVSLFLTNRVVHDRKVQTGLLAYLARRGRRMSLRNVIAAKLSYCPLALEPGEFEVVRNRFGWEPMLSRKYKIKEVAERLRFKSPAVLSRWLYKLSGWVRSDLRRRRIDAQGKRI